MEDNSKKPADLKRLEEIGNSSRTVVIYSVHKVPGNSTTGHNQYTLRLPDKNGVPYTGQEGKSEAQLLKNDKYIVQENEQEVLFHGRTLNFATPKDRVNWRWMIQTRVIAPDIATAQRDKNYQFYVHDQVHEEEQKYNRNQAVAKAIAVISDKTEKERASMIKLLGKGNPINLKQDEIYNILFTVANDDPRKIENVANIGDKKHELLLIDLIHKGIITKQGGGVYKYEDSTIGFSKEEAIGFLENVENKDVIDQMKAELNV